MSWFFAFWNKSRKAIVYIGVSTHPQKYPLFLAKLPSNVQTVQAPFLGNCPSILVFREPPLKIVFFSEPPKNPPVWILSYDQEKHFCLSTFSVIKYFRFSFIFYVKIESLPKKGHTHLSHQPSSEHFGPVKPPFFENLVGSSTPSAERGGVHYES